MSNNWIQTYTGRKVYPFEATSDDIRIADIAHSLSNQARYLGHTPSPVTIAQHSCLVALACPPEYQLWGLLHDASEAYLGDIPAPIKHTPVFQLYREYEARLMSEICIAFKLPLEEPIAVKLADKRALATEIRDFMRPREDWPTVVGDPLPLEGAGEVRGFETPWSSRKAETLFLDCYRLLTERKSTLRLLDGYYNETLL